jgi:hypothetical protein
LPESRYTKGTEVVVLFADIPFIPLSLSTNSPMRLLFVPSETTAQTADDPEVVID